MGQKWDILRFGYRVARFAPGLCTGLFSEEEQASCLFYYPSCGLHEGCSEGSHELPQDLIKSDSTFGTATRMKTLGTPSTSLAYFPRRNRQAACSTPQVVGYMKAAPKEVTSFLKI